MMMSNLTDDTDHIVECNAIGYPAKLISTAAGLEFVIRALSLTDKVTLPSSIFVAAAYVLP
jgi:hypothetical protein